MINAMAVAGLASLPGMVPGKIMAGSAAKGSCALPGMGNVSHYRCDWNRLSDDSFSRTLLPN